MWTKKKWTESNKAIITTQKRITTTIKKYSNNNLYVVYSFIRAVAANVSLVSALNGSKIRITGAKSCARGAKKLCRQIKNPWTKRCRRRHRLDSSRLKVIVFGLDSRKKSFFFLLYFCVSHFDDVHLLCWNSTIVSILKFTDGCMAAREYILAFQQRNKKCKNSINCVLRVLNNLTRNKREKQQQNILELIEIDIEWEEEKIVEDREKNIIECCVRCTESL